MQMQDGTVACQCCMQTNRLQLLCTANGTWVPSCITQSNGDITSGFVPDAVVLLEKTEHEQCAATATCQQAAKQAARTTKQEESKYNTASLHTSTTTHGVHAANRQRHVT